MYLHYSSFVFNIHKTTTTVSSSVCVKEHVRGVRWLIFYWIRCLINSQDVFNILRVPRVTSNLFKYFCVVSVHIWNDVQKYRVILMRNVGGNNHTVSNGTYTTNAIACLAENRISHNIIAQWHRAHVSLLVHRNCDGFEGKNVFEVDPRLRHQLLASSSDSREHRLIIKTKII